MGRAGEFTYCEFSIAGGPCLWRPMEQMAPGTWGDRYTGSVRRTSGQAAHVAMGGLTLLIGLLVNEVKEPAQGV